MLVFAGRRYRNAVSGTADPVEFVNLLNHVAFPGAVGSLVARVVFARVYRSKCV